MDKLLKLLEEDARLSNEELAVMLSMDQKELEEKIEKFENDGVIKGYKALINWERSEYNRASAIIELKVTPKKESGFDDIARRIMAFEEVDGVYLMSGGYDLSVFVSGKTMQDIALFVVRRLSPIDGVLSTATHFILKKYKDGGVVFDDPSYEEDKRGNMN